MSIIYQRHLISALSDQIDNKTPTTDKVYSSAYIHALINLVNKHIGEIGEIKPSVKGIVGTKAELDGYDKTRLQDRDIIYVLSDETHNGYTSYWRYDMNNDVFTFIGSLSPYYSPTEIDAFIGSKQEKLVSGENIKTVGGKSLVGEGDLTVGYTLEILYPVGSIYTTVDDNFDPNISFGGTWTQVDAGDFLVSTGTAENPNTYDFGLNKRGGQATVTLTLDTIPQHYHAGYSHTHSISTTGVQSSTTATINTGTVFAIPAINSISSRNNDGEYDDFQLGTVNWATKHTWTDTDWIPVNTRASVSLGVSMSNTNYTGGSQSHNNLPAYYLVHYWYRTA